MGIMVVVGRGALKRVECAESISTRTAAIAELVLSNRTHGPARMGVSIGRKA